jgi:hypothetical protein
MTRCHPRWFKVYASWTWRLDSGGKVDRKMLRKTAVSITIIPVVGGLPQAPAAVRDCASSAQLCV